MTVDATEVFRGAAVVIDDRIDDPQDSIRAIIEQLESAEVPTVHLKALPSTDSLVHWKQFGLVVLDWELSYSTADTETTIPRGISVPTGLTEKTSDENVEFISSLLDQTAMPIFVASNANIDKIREELKDALPNHATGLEDRVKVFAKSDLTVELFEPIKEWVNSRPALKALRAWKRAYTEAEIQTFHQFSRAEVDWVVSIHRAAIADNASPEATLRDLLASNILNRIGPLGIDMDPPPPHGLTDATALRRLLHASAVLPDKALVAGQPGTGDLFVENAAQEPYEEIRILLTPECDLPARGKPRRFTYLTGVRKVNVNSKDSAKRMEAFRKTQDLHLKSNLLTTRGDEYEIALKNWQSIWIETPSESGSDEIWPGYRRIGRLLDPYLTHIQQNFSMVTIRKGLPRLPEDFYAGWVDG